MLQLGVLSSMIVTYCLPMFVGQRIAVAITTNDMLGGFARAVDVFHLRVQQAAVSSARRCAVDCDATTV